MIKTPQNQKRLTNIAVVKFCTDKHGKFEIACYPNKVMAWRNETEKKIEEVVQSQKVFRCVHKGELANKKELALAFKNKNEREVILEILKNGEMQISEKERNSLQTNMLNEIINNLKDMSIDPNTNVPHTAKTIEAALKLHRFKINVNKSSKQQTLEAAKILEKSKNINFKKANMKIKVSVPISVIESEKINISKQLKPFCEKVESIKKLEKFVEAMVVVNPGQINILNLEMQKLSELIQVEMIELKSCSQKDVTL